MKRVVVPVLMICAICIPNVHGGFFDKIKRSVADMVKKEAEQEADDAMRDAVGNSKQPPPAKPEETEESAKPELSVEANRDDNSLAKDLGQPSPHELMPGTYVATISPWVATVNGSERIVGEVRLEGTAAGIGIHSVNPDIDLHLTTGAKLDRLKSGEGAYANVSPTSRQTRERTARLAIKPLFAGARPAVWEEIPVFVGGAEPPPEASYVWLMEIDGDESYVSIRYVGPANLDVYRMKAPRDMPVVIECSLRILPQDKILESRGVDFRQLMPAAKMRALYGSEADHAEITQIEVTDDMLTRTSPEPVRENATEPKPKVTAGPQWLEFEDIDAIGQEEVMKAADDLPPGEAEQLLSIYRHFRIGWSRQPFSPEALTLQYLVYVQWKGEKVVFRPNVIDGALYTDAEGMFDSCFSPTLLMEQMRRSTLEVFEGRSDNMKRMGITPDSVADKALEIHTERVASGNYTAMSACADIFNTALKECMNTGGSE